ncbi:hypothetical protein LZ318_30775 [Saccharopolyspora indica]|uniref:hypothetical protein n=1 Tax=Saccharopolyspora indica TaxID=1229659 RepID=UPI0022EA30B9|nr:hypothetical protein [Saccharopolyspora indica]MDA3644383.1 hypothetical protein [Saccharopolyspora indica]
MTAPDHFDHLVNSYAQAFVPQAPPIPSRPPAAATSCGCPECSSEGFSTGWPLCGFWRADCWLCEGRREWTDLHAPADSTRHRCGICDDAWRRDLRFFREALRDPRALATRLREDAARRTAADHRVGRR